MSGLRILKKPLFLLWVCLVVAILVHLDALLQTLTWTARGTNRHTLVNYRNPDGITGEVSMQDMPQNDSLPNLKELLTNGLVRRSIKVPDISDVLIHLKNKPNIFEPALKMSSVNRQNVTVVIGIPHVNRKIAFYLHKTLKSLINNLRPEEAKDCLIVVMYSDVDHSYNMKAMKTTSETFPEHVKSGLLELIVTPPSFYPDLAKLAIISERNGDSIERWKWRSKENLDAAFLMNYAYPKGKFYLMTEDDVTTVPGYFSEIKPFALNPPRQNWYIMGFSEYGSKGILFRSGDCPMFVNFILNFYGAWPVDWLLDDFLMIWGCKKNTDASCGTKKNTLRLDYKRHLFIHIGYHSSLKGKIMNDAAKS